MIVITELMFSFVWGGGDWYVTCRLFHLSECAPPNLRLTLNTNAKRSSSFWVINRLLYRSSPLIIFRTFSLPPCLSISSLCAFFFYAQNKTERTHGCRRNAETIGSTSGHHGDLDSHHRQHARRTLRYRWIICNHLPSFTGRKFCPGFNVANRGFRRSVFHVKVGLRNSRTGCQSRQTADFPPKKLCVSAPRLLRLRTSGTTVILCFDGMCRLKGINSISVFKFCDVPFWRDNTIKNV